VQGVEQPPARCALHREALGVHGDVERAVGRPHHQERSKERRGIRRDGGEDDGGKEQRRRADDGARAAAGRQRADQGLRGEQSDRGAEEGDPHRSRAEAEVVLNRRHPPVPAAEHGSVEKEDPGDGEVLSKERHAPIITGRLTRSWRYAPEGVKPMTLAPAPALRASSGSSSVRTVPWATLPPNPRADHRRVVVPAAHRAGA
jgi:hypothetical protein